MKAFPLTILRFALGVILGLPLASLAQTTTIYDSGGFESPVFLLEQDLDGQDPAAPIGNGPWAQDSGSGTAIVTGINPVEGTKSVKVNRDPGATGNTRWGVVKPTVPSGNNNVIDIRFDMKVERRAGEFGPMFGVEAYDYALGAPKLIASLLLDASNGEIVYRTAGVGEFAGSGYFTDVEVHHHYRLSLNFTDKNYTLFVDGSPVHTEGFVDPLGAAFYDAPLATISNGVEDDEGTAWFDNYRIEQTTSHLPHLLWQGDALSNAWSVGGASNWDDGISAVAYADGNVVRFDDTGSNSPAVELQGSLLPTAVEVVASQNYVFSGSGSIDGATVLVKEGTGTLSLSGANGYSGDTEVLEGELSVRNTTGSATGTSIVSVYPPATVSGDGTVGGSLWVGQGAIVEPGVAGQGILNVANQLVLDDAALRFELGSSSDQLVAGGDLTLGGTLEITDAGGFGPGTYTLITYGGELTGETLSITSAPENLAYSIRTDTPGVVELVVTAPPPAPTAPTGLTATSTGTMGIDLNWSDQSNNEDSFVIERSEDNGAFSVIASVGADETTYSDTGLAPGTTYSYRVKATNSGGESAYSNVASATTDTSPTVAHYEYELTTLDSSGNNHHGLPVGTVLYDSGQVGDYAATFDGTAFVEIPRVVENSFTVMMWIKTTGNTGSGAWYNGMGLVDGEMVGSAADWGCSVLGSKFAFGVGNPDTTITSNRSINDGLWHHVATTRDNDTGEVRIYIDGALDAVDSAPTGPRTAPTQLRIGATQTAVPKFYVGGMDDLRFYGSTLSESEINEVSGLPNPPPAGEPLVIHPLGDSITWGYTTGSLADSPGGYREPLYRNLLLNGDQPIHFVGANTSNPGPLIDRDGQIAHDGYPQYTLTEIRLNLDSNHWTGKTRGNNGGYWLTGGGVRPAINPHIILLLAGTNDIEEGADAATIESRMDAMLEKIFTLRPDTKVFLASIPPYPADAVKTATARAYNALMASNTVPKHLSLGRNIRFVDQYANFILAYDPGGDVVNSALFGDTIHPNESGYQLMGDTWAEAVLADPVPLPAAPTNLAFSIPSAGTVELTWTDHADNEGAYLIERSTDGVNFSTIGHVGANETAYTDSDVESLVYYSYRVVARNSSGDSAYSNKATPGGFDAWATWNFTTSELAAPSLSGPLADFDGDGITNLEEYAFDGDPKASDLPILPTTSVVDGYLVLTFTRLKDRADINYVARSSPDLTTFTPVAQSILGGEVSALNGGAVTATPVGGDPDKESVKARDHTPTAEAPHRFMHLEISRP